MKKVICLVGESGAGKGAVLDVLSKQGFTVFSLSAQVRKTATELGLQNPTRAELQLMANEMRSHFGADYFAQRVITDELFSSEILLVIDGVRNLSELKAIRSVSGISTKIHVWAVRAGVETRYKRVIERRDPSDPLSYEQFLENDKRESGVDGNEFSQQNAACIEVADLQIWNEGTLEELEKIVISNLEMHDLAPEGQRRNPKERL